MSELRNWEEYLGAYEPVVAIRARPKLVEGFWSAFGRGMSQSQGRVAVPVTVVTDQSKAQWVIKSASSQQEDSTGTKVAKLAFCGFGCGGFTKFEGTIQVIDVESSAILFAYNVKKSNFQSAAEAFRETFQRRLLGYASLTKRQPGDDEPVG